MALFTLDFARQTSAAEAILTDDTYTDAAKATTNFGNVATLPVSGSGATLKRTWIKFNIPGVLPAGTTASQISKATLKLWVSTVTTGGPVNLYVVTGTTAWVEGTGAAGSGITNGTAPALAATPLISGWQITSASNYAVVDLTALVQSWVSGTTPNQGIALTPGASTVNVSFDSKESTTTSHGAQLEIQLVNQGPTGPQGPQGLTGAVGPQGSQGLQGVAGAAGAIGATGLQGVAGAVGPAGAAGAVGPKGLNWKGAWSAATGYVANDAVSINGSAYTALVANTNVQPPSAATWSLLAQKGDIGTTGAQGPQGLTGAAGAAGATGATGSAGSQGPQGLTGAVGPQGFQGLTGAMGPIGPQGLTGATGAIGPIGPQGLQGDSFWQAQGANIFFNAGRLGLGTATPAQVLDVAGNAQITGNLIITGAGSKVILPVQGDLSMGEFIDP